jgi:hypothetical protein
MDANDTRFLSFASEVASLLDQADKIRKATDLVKPAMPNWLDPSRTWSQALSPSTTVANSLNTVLSQIPSVPLGLLNTRQEPNLGLLGLASFDSRFPQAKHAAAESCRAALLTSLDNSGLLAPLKSYPKWPTIEIFAPNPPQQNISFLKHVSGIESPLGLLSNQLIDSIKSSQLGTMLFDTNLQSTGLLGNLANITHTASRTSTELAQIFATYPAKDLAFMEAAPYLAAFTGSHLVDRLTRAPGQDETPMPGRQRAVEEIKSTTKGDLEELLLGLGHGFATMMKGAHRARNSSNPERSRHVSVSLRELFTAVLHVLAPDQQVIAWVEDPALLKDGRPTRRARVMFVCRGINSGACSMFVDADVRLTSSLFDSLQAGTHSRDQHLTDSQLDALLLRVETQLLFLLGISKLT